MCFFYHRKECEGPEVTWREKTMWGGCGPRPHSRRKEEQKGGINTGKERPIGLKLRKRDIHWQDLEEEGG